MDVSLQFVRYWVVSRWKRLWAVDDFTPDEPGAECAAESVPFHGLASAVWTVLLLLALCAAARWVQVKRVAYIYPDGAVLLTWAEAVDEGKGCRYFPGQQPNWYVLGVVAMHRAGWGWEDAGQLWSFWASSLAAAPFYFWLRWMCGPRTAWWGGLLFCLHPGLIGWSAEVVRDTSCWCATAVALSCLWKGTATGRWRWWIAGGAAAACAVQTRSEGWLLLAPMLGWPVVALALDAWNRRWKRGGNPAWSGGRLAWGTALASAVLFGLPPIVSTVPTASVGAQESHNWEHWRMVGRWIVDLGGGRSQEPEKSVETPTIKAWGASTVDSDLTGREIFWGLRTTLAEGVTRPFLALALLGFLSSPGRWLQPRYWPIAFAVAANVACMAIYFQREGAIVDRYAIPVLLYLAPLWAAGAETAFRGATAVGKGIGRAVGSEDQGRRWGYGGATAAATALAAWGCTTAWREQDVDRRPMVEFGRWARAEYGEGRTICGGVRFQRLFGYYSGGEFTLFSPREQADHWAATFESRRPDLLVLYEADAELACQPVLQRAERLGYREVDPATLPPDRGGARLWVRDGTSKAVARRIDAGQGEGRR